jgi:hypothetical protein
VYCVARDAIQPRLRGPAGRCLSGNDAPRHQRARGPSRRTLPLDVVRRQKLGQGTAPAAQPARHANGQGDGHGRSPGTRRVHKAAKSGAMPVYAGASICAGQRPCAAHCCRSGARRVLSPAYRPTRPPPVLCGNALLGWTTYTGGTHQVRSVSSSIRRVSSSSRTLLVVTPRCLPSAMGGREIGR